MHRASLFLAACLPSIALTAQTNFPATISASCNGGTTAFMQDALESSPASALVPLADFGAAAPGSCDADVMFSHGVFWRLSSDTRLSQFYDTGAAGDQGGITMSQNADSWTVRWPDVDNRGLLDATWNASVTCCGATCGQVEHEWTLLNTSSATQTFEFYAHTDFDYGVNFRNETTPDATGDRQIIRLDPTFPAPCPGLAEFFGENITSWEVDAFPFLRVKMTGATFGGLSGQTLPFPPDDYEGAMGWTLTLNAGESTTVVYTHGQNCLNCTAQSSVSLYGASHGSTTIGTNDTPAPGCAVTLDVTGPPNVAATMLVGAPLSANLPGCPQWIHVNPIFSIQSNLDASGQVEFLIPAGTAPLFCGVTVYFQAFALNPGEPCIPLQNSSGFAVTYGHP